MKIFLWLLSFAIMTGTTFAQNMLGIASGNFAGSAGMNLNPTSMLLMPNRWEIGLMTVNIQAENNYIGYPKFHLKGGNENGVVYPNGGLVANNSSTSKTAGIHALIKVPSFILRVNNWAFALSTSVRTDASIRGIDPTLASILFNGPSFPAVQSKPVKIGGTKISQLSWVETSFSAGKQLSKSESRKWLVAVSGKYITGLEGVFVKLDGGDMRISNDTTLSMTSIHGKAGYGAISDPSQIIHGKLNGLGTDLGICFISNPFGPRFYNGKLLPAKRYNYRIGVSILDLGFVNFSKNAVTYSINTPAITYNNVTAVHVNGNNGIDSLIQADFMNSSKQKFFIGLPTAASIQYDKCLHPRWYFNLTAVQRMPLPYAHVYRANSLSASIRYETPYFEVAMPYSFYDYYRHRIGLAVRYHILMIGTDKIGTFLGKNDITGLDVYFGIKISSFEFQHKKRIPRVVCAAYL